VVQYQCFFVHHPVGGAMFIDGMLQKTQRRSEERKTS